MTLCYSVPSIFDRNFLNCHLLSTLCQSDLQESGTLRSGTLNGVPSLALCLISSMSLQCLILEGDYDSPSSSPHNHPSAIWSVLLSLNLHIFLPLSISCVMASVRHSAVQFGLYRMTKLFLIHRVGEIKPTLVFIL